jgi:hypothetical protein
VLFDEQLFKKLKEDVPKVAPPFLASLFKVIPDKVDHPCYHL